MLKQEVVKKQDLSEIEEPATKTHYCFLKCICVHIILFIPKKNDKSLLHSKNDSERSLVDSGDCYVNKIK